MGNTGHIYAPEASYEAWKYRIFRPKERRQQHCRGIQQKDGGLNGVITTVIALTCRRHQAGKSGMLFPGRRQQRYVPYLPGFVTPSPSFDYISLENLWAQ